jgi:hypothetical protein
VLPQRIDCRAGLPENKVSFNSSKTGLCWYDEVGREAHKGIVAGSEKTFERNFNTRAFQRTPLRRFGNVGNGMSRGPGQSNFDTSLAKRVQPLLQGKAP